MISKLRLWHSRAGIPHSTGSPWSGSVCKTTWAIDTNRMVKAEWACDISTWGVTNADVNDNITALNSHFHISYPPSPLEHSSSVFLAKGMAFVSLCQPWLAEPWSFSKILFSCLVLTSRTPIPFSWVSVPFLTFTGGKKVNKCHSSFLSLAFSFPTA